jgi:DNA-directed RNA polymerase specialized sigma24 family protein
MSDEELVVGLRGGDDAAFLMLVERYHASLVQLAQTFVHGSAADVVRGALTDVLSGLASFDDRSSLRVSLFRAVIDQARARSPLAESLTSEPLGPSMDPAQFRGPHEQYYGEALAQALARFLTGES